MLERNKKLIEAIIEKADRDCPGALAMIGIYGSFLTGDIHDKSDLDLLILVNDGRGYGLAATFILEDESIGHDLYCTTWEQLEADASFTHPHISKLMDSEIVYCADPAYLIRLETLRCQAMTADTRSAAENALKEAERCFAKALLATDLPDIRFWSGYMIHQIFDSIALVNHRYFKLGTRRVFDEIEAMIHKPDNLRSLVDPILQAGNPDALKAALPPLMQAAEELFPAAYHPAEIFPGTYEEMFSNWRNKMYLAAETNDRYLSFSSLGSLDVMLKELGYTYDVMAKYNPEDLLSSAKAFDNILEEYRKEYDKADIAIATYPDVDVFIDEYIKNETAR